MSVDGATVDNHRIPYTVPLTWRIFEGLDVGGDHSTPVDANYSSPNRFTGSISQVVFNTGPMKLAAQQMQEFYNLRLAAAMGYQ